MLNNLCKLCRLNKPIGIFLLIWPVIWGLLVVNYQNTHALYIFIFLMGTVVMRSAGCVINDIADKSFDAKVDRTKDRILAKEALSTKTALLFLFCLLIIALLLLLFLPIACVSDAIIAVILSMIYPLCKRFFVAPQLILGIAFSVALPMIYHAYDRSFDVILYQLICINIVWVIAYDTFYAMTDKNDDLKIGIFSTAILFGRFDGIIAILLLLSVQTAWVILFFQAMSLLGLIGILFSFIVIYFQIRYVSFEQTPFKAFLMNGYLGGAWTMILLGYLYPSFTLYHL